MTCRDFNDYVGVCAGDETEELRTRLASADPEHERKLCLHSYQVAFVGGLLSVFVVLVMTGVFLSETKTMVNNVRTISSDTIAWSEDVDLPEIAIVMPHWGYSHIMGMLQCTIPYGNSSAKVCKEYNTSTLERIIVPKFEVITNNSFSYKFPPGVQVQGTFGDPVYTYCEVSVYFQAWRTVLHSSVCSLPHCAHCLSLYSPRRTVHCASHGVHSLSLSTALLTMHCVSHCVTP